MIINVSEVVTRSGPTYWFIFLGNEILMPEGNGMIQFEDTHRVFHLPTQASLFIGMDGGVPFHAVDLNSTAGPPQDFRFSDIRGIYGRTDDEFHDVSARASHLLLFDRTMKSVVFVVRVTC